MNTKRFFGLMTALCLCFSVQLMAQEKDNALNVEVVEKENDKKAVTEKSSDKATIVVTGTRTRRNLKDVAVRTEVVSKEKIEQSGAKNMFEILDKGLITGVTVNNSCTNCNFSEIRMQGLEGGYSLMLFDGQPIFSALAGVYGLRQISPANIERIEVVKGASSALYGSSALGGVINIISKEPEEGKVHAGASYTYGIYDQDFDQASWDADGNISFREGNVAFILTGSRHHNDYVLTNSDDYTDKVEQDTKYLSAKTHLYFDKDKHRFTVFGRAYNEFRRGGNTGPGTAYIDEDWDGTADITRPVDHAIDNPFDPDAEHITTDRWEYGAAYRGVFDAGNSLDINYIQSLHKRDATNGARPFKSEEDVYIVDAVYSHPGILKINTVTAGINYKQEDLSQVIAYQKDKDKKSKTISGFVQDEIQAMKDFQVVLGVRYDNVFDSSLQEDYAFSPRVALKYDITKKIVARAAYGWGFKVPGLFAEDLHLCSAAPRVYVPDNLKSEKSQSVNGGIAFYGDKLFIDTNFFYTLIQDKIALDPEGNNAPTGYTANFENVDDAYTTGVEVNASYQIIRDLAVNATYTFTSAEYDNGDEIQRVPDHAASLGLDYHNHKQGIKAGLTGRYTGKQYVARVMVADGKEYVDHVDGFFVLDARVSKDINYGNWTYTVFVGCDNITNEVQDKIYNAEQEDSAAYIYAPVTGRYIYAGLKMAL